MKDIYVQNVMDCDDFLTLSCSKDKYRKFDDKCESLTINKRNILDYKIYKDSQVVLSAKNSNKTNFSFGKAILGKALLGDAGVVMGLSNNTTTGYEVRNEYSTVLIYLKIARYEKYDVTFDELKLDLIYETYGLNGYFVPYDSIVENLNIIGSFLEFTDVASNNEYFKEKTKELDDFEKSLEIIDVKRLSSEKDLDRRIKESQLKQQKIEPYNKILTLPYNRNFKKYDTIQKLSDFTERDKKKFIENNLNNNNNLSKKKKSIRGLNKYDAIVAIVEVNGEEFTCEFKDIAIRINCEVFVYLFQKRDYLNSAIYIGTIKKIVPFKFKKGEYNNWRRNYSYELHVDGFVLFQTHYLQTGTKEKILEDIRKHSNTIENLSEYAKMNYLDEDSLFLLEKFNISQTVSISSYCSFEKKKLFDDYKNMLDNEITEIKKEIDNIHFLFLKKNQQKKVELEKRIKDIKKIITSIDVSKKFSLTKLVNNNDYYFIFRKYFLNTKDNNPWEYYNNEIDGRELYNNLMKIVKEKLKNVMINYCDYCVDSDIYPHPVDSSSRNELLFYNLEIPNYKDVKDISVKILFPQNIDENIYEFSDCIIKPLRVPGQIIHEDTIEYHLSKWICLKLFESDGSICFESPTKTWKVFEENKVGLNQGVNVISLIGYSIPIVIVCSPLTNSIKPYEKRNISLTEYVNAIDEIIQKNERKLSDMEKEVLRNSELSDLSREDIIEQKKKIRSLKQLQERIKLQIKSN